MELLLAGNMITVDLNFGVMNQGDEKNQDPATATNITMNKGFRHLYRKITRFEESKSSPLLILLVIGEKSKLLPKVDKYPVLMPLGQIEILNNSTVLTQDFHQGSETKKFQQGGKNHGNKQYQRKTWQPLNIRGKER
jgi:hypothetical protein